MDKEVVENSKIYSATIQEAEDGSLFIEIPAEILTHLGWKEGDELHWDETEVCHDHGEFKGLILEKK